MKFSQRIGKTPVRTALQIDYIDKALANRLWNSFLSFLAGVSDYTTFGSESERTKVLRAILEGFFNERRDEIPSSYYSMIESIKNHFFKSEWFEKYDFIEYIALFDSNFIHQDFSSKCNIALEMEFSGYRFIENRLIQITSEEEIDSIEAALNDSSKWKPVQIHIETALEHLSNRKNPDYRNSIKESISAVESFCRILTGDNNATLGTALTQIEKTHKIHGALKRALNSLYGYTSDSGGIRHALFEGDHSVEIGDAKFMLVSCSAFINYMKSKIQ